MGFLSVSWRIPQRAPTVNHRIRTDLLTPGRSAAYFHAIFLKPFSNGADGEIVLGTPTEFTSANIDEFNF
ncbi:hypothetical protein [Kribbella alba]|uniref:hypothetical protein n=1 Tax=Kribbella alba TaxID=190197 RepID=UPI0031DED04C